MYLQRRNRILRQSPAIRAMVAETILTPDDFIVPLFIDEGKGWNRRSPRCRDIFDVAWKAP